MRYCPTCQTEYDEDIIRFCTKDGTPLVDDKKPTFTENLPSETSQDDEDDFSANKKVSSSSIFIPTLPDTRRKDTKRRGKKRANRRRAKIERSRIARYF